MKDHKEEQTSTLIINKITQCKYIYILILMLMLIPMTLFLINKEIIPLSIKVNSSLQNEINRTTVSNDTKCRLNDILLLPIIDRREDLGIVLSNENKTHGLEIGVQRGGFSKEILQRWTNCKQYYLIDPWQHQDNYEDAANVPQQQQNNLFEITKKTLSVFEYRTKLIYIRNYSTNAHQLIKDNSLDFIYIDARHDYKSLGEDLTLFWPKLKKDGIFAGHDFLNADEEAKEDWCKLNDGTRCKNNKAVKAAVEEFVSKKCRQLLVPRRETIWVTWYLRK